MKRIILSLVLLISAKALSQNTSIAIGEKLTYSASYVMSGLLTDLAEVTMETSEVNTSKSKLMKLKCTAATYTKWDSFFKIRDLYESYVSPSSLTPYLYNRDINEGGYNKFMKYKFDHKTNTVASLKRKLKKDGSTVEEKKTVKIGNATRDLVTTLYYIRNMEIHKAKIGDNQNFTIIFDNKEMVINVKYLGKETLNSVLGKTECYKLAISLKNSDVLKGNNDNLIWLSADANKIPIYAKFKIAVGSGELKLKRASGMLN
ncbi:DUF3108 domain-containing protein [Subsaximicrobium wynnwilliamsii]|uniref:DUF3108 domain-containing protein n=1 Tax=Subsaximicrobium wynnwilliamsii TaxID=291179 RepID=A0A5C6ZM46_9FLAO|nr:DUF3108 domain-containing protein [Subsaximicrobium wynnwilliamsii]TXD84786.1 DUF3108 domain-containing protein [Subsaximicrobium wynnwilliamsii]TXD90457.1 DUF3108 domain-containing protein [Subsaximicrobium wynnwilliamsii]TXE04933.1 DUF3108 domain-containing protein [Subsaximicrobium wynnwilliamsii]